jgi:hypothetical protein
MRGLGAVLNGGWAGAIVPATTGAIVTLGSTLGMRAALKPMSGTASATLYRWAPGLGVIAGLVAAAAMYLMGGTKAAVQGAVSSVIVGGGVLALDALNSSKPGSAIAIAFGAGGTQAVAAPGAQPPGTAAIVPEYSGVNGIVYRQLNGTDGLGANDQHQGEVVNLRGVINTDAFGPRT